MCAAWGVRVPEHAVEVSSGISRPDGTAQAPAPGVDVDGNAAVVKACLAWGGLNDKVAILPRRYAADWMRLLEASRSPRR